MLILYHHRTQAEDAQGVHIRAMVNAFRNVGHDVRVAGMISAENRGETERARRRALRWIAEKSPRWFYELMSLVYNVYGYRTLSRLIRETHPDLIYERYSLNTLCGIWAAHHHRIPIVVEVNAPLRHEQEALGALAFRRIALATERWICSNADLTIAVSGALRDLLISEGVRPKNLVVMPNGVDPARFFVGVSGANVIERHGLAGSRVVGFVGWIREWHGVGRLLQGMHGAGMLSDDLKLLIVGEGPASNQLRHYVRDNGLERHVVFAGVVEREAVPEYIAAMDVAVQPSATSYASPMKIIEYMSMGKAIVAPDQPNIRELLQDGRNGYLFDPAQPGSLVDAVARALADPARERIGETAYRDVYDRGYLWSENAKTTLRCVFSAEAENAPRVEGGTYDRGTERVVRDQRP